MVLLYVLYFFVKLPIYILRFSILSLFQVFCLAHLNIFMLATLNSLSDNSDICVISMLASVYFFWSFKDNLGMGSGFFKSILDILDLF